MGWKQAGQPVVRQQRGRFVVRVDGVDTETGTVRPRQLGTFTSRRAAQKAATEAASAGDAGGNRGTVGWLAHRWAASRTDVSPKTRQQYEWAAGHIATGLGTVRLDRLDRSDVADWLEDLADGGVMARRSIQIVRMVLRAALDDAVEEGLIRRNPAARVAMPREVARRGRSREADVWTDEQVDRFLAVAAEHRWGGPLRLAVLFGVRRSELLALRWDDVDVRGRTIRIDEGLIEVDGKPFWTDCKNDRSRRIFAVDAATVKALTRHRGLQNEERLVAGRGWQDAGLVVTTRTGGLVHPGNFDQTLDRLVKKAGVPRLTSHGLRHTAATHMVRQAADAGELRAVADVLGHSPDMLMRVYAHALPDSIRAVADRVGARRGARGSGAP